MPAKSLLAAIPTERGPTRREAAPLRELSGSICSSTASAIPTCHWQVVARQAPRSMDAPCGVYEDAGWKQDG